MVAGMRRETRRREARNDDSFNTALQPAFRAYGLWSITSCPWEWGAGREGSRQDVGQKRSDWKGQRRIESMEEQEHSCKAVLEANPTLKNTDAPCATNLLCR